MGKQIRITSSELYALLINLRFADIDFRAGVSEEADGFSLLTGTVNGVRLDGVSVCIETNKSGVPLCLASNVFDVTLEENRVTIKPQESTTSYRIDLLTGSFLHTLFYIERYGNEFYSNDHLAYKKALMLKSSGILPRIEDIPRSFYVDLWHFEGFSDETIAYLFNTSAKKARYYRSKLGVLRGNLSLEMSMGVLRKTTA